jgi:hypothetical protein
MNASQTIPEVSRRRRVEIMTPDIRGRRRVGPRTGVAPSCGERNAVLVTLAPSFRDAIAGTFEPERLSHPCHGYPWLGLLSFDAAGPNPRRPPAAEYSERLASRVERKPTAARNHSSICNPFSQSSYSEDVAS